MPVTGMGSGVISMSVGVDACAVKDDGNVWCWGYGTEDQLGNGQTNDALVPVQLTTLSGGVTSVASGNWSSCVVQRGQVLCWGGDDGNGELGTVRQDRARRPCP